MEFKELEQKNIEELEKLLAEKRTGLWNFRFSMTGGKVKNVKEGAALRKEIARIMTALSTKQSQVQK